MNKSKVFLGKRGGLSVLLMLVLFGTAISLLPSCKMEDDTPPPSAYVEPEPDTTGACVYLNVTPELNGDSAISFECKGPGEYDIFGEKDGGTVTIERDDNPATGGINPSEKVIKVTQDAGIEPWAGLFFDLASKVDFAGYDGIKIKVYSPAAGQLVNLKLEDQADPNNSAEIAVTTTVANEWEELCFPFSPGDSDKFDRFVLFFDFNGPKDAETVHYFDDIILGNGCMIVVPTEPTMAAPTPTVPESDVISIFSDAYTNVTGTDFDPNWGQGTDATEVDIAGNNTLKYDNLNYQGVVLENALDVSGMDMLHIDYWTGNSTAFSGFLISSGPVETSHAFTLSTEQWVSVDIPLSEFSSVVDLTDIIQMKFEGNGTIYLDNIYFLKEQATAPTTAATAPTAPAADVISVFSDAYTDVAGTNFDPDWGQATDATIIDIDGNSVLKYENLNYQGTQFVNPLDVSGMTTMHVDYWTANSTGFNGFLISSGPEETSHAFDPVTTGEWVGVDIPLTTFSGVVDLADVIQMKFDGDGTIYLDNIYFKK